MDQRRTAELAIEGDEVSLAARLRAVLGPLSRELRQQSSGELTATQVSVLASVVRHGPMPLGELANRERLSPPRISKVVDSLEEADLVERTRDQADRRVWLVSATPAAVRWIEQGRALRDAWLAERLVEMDGADLAALAGAIPVLERLLGDRR
jgi:DNA-binding MarR family transcriptional regulator